MLNDIKPPPLEPDHPLPPDSGKPAPADRTARVDPQVKETAGESPIADVGVYDRPNTERFSMGNIGLTAGVGIVVLILVIILMIWLLL